MYVDSDLLIPGVTIKNGVYSANFVKILPSGHTITVEDISKIKKMHIEQVGIEISNEKETFSNEFNNIVKSIIRNPTKEKITKISNNYRELAFYLKKYKFYYPKYIANRLSVQDHFINMINMSVAMAGKYNELNDDEIKIPIEIVVQTCLYSLLGYYPQTNSEVLHELKIRYDNLIKSHKIADSILDKYDSKYANLYSYLRIKSDDGVSETVKKALLVLNENYDNKKGPLQIKLKDKNETYSKIAQIIRTVSFYDLLLIQSGNNSPLNQFSGIQDELNRLVREGFIDDKWVNLIPYALPVYSIDELVTLSDGTIGTVVSVNPYDFLRPKIVSDSGDLIELNDELYITGKIEEQKSNRRTL